MGQIDLSIRKIQKFSHHTEINHSEELLRSYLWPWECRLYHCASISSAQVRTHTWLIRNPSFLGLRSTRPLPFVAVGNRHPAGCSHSLPVSPQGTNDYSHLYRRLYFSEMLEEDPADSLLSYLCCIIQVLQGSKISIDISFKGCWGQMIFLGGIRIRSQEGTNTTPKLKDHSVSPAQKSCWIFLKHNEDTPFCGDGFCWP